MGQTVPDLGIKISHIDNYPHNTPFLSGGLDVESSIIQTMLSSPFLLVELDVSDSLKNFHTIF